MVPLAVVAPGPPACGTSCSSPPPSRPAANTARHPRNDPYREPISSPCQGHSRSTVYPSLAGPRRDKSIVAGIAVADPDIDALLAAGRRETLTVRNHTRIRIPVQVVREARHGTGRIRQPPQLGNPCLSCRSRVQQRRVVDPSHLARRGPHECLHTAVGHRYEHCVPSQHSAGKTDAGGSDHGTIGRPRDTRAICTGIG